MSMAGMTDETLQMAQDALRGGSSNVQDYRGLTFRREIEAAKAAGVTTGLNYLWYDLSPLVGHAYPITDMLIRYIPRTKGDGGTATHWQMFTGVNTTNVPFGVPEGRRNAALSFQTKYYTAPYQHYASESFTTFQAQYGSKNLSPDGRAAQTLATLNNSRIQEELYMLGGNRSILLGQGATPTIADVGTGGAIASGATVYVGVVPLTLIGFNVLGGADGVLPAATTVLPLVSRTSPFQTVADSVGGYMGKVSALANITVAADGNNTHSVTASTTPVQGAAGYLWFVGASSGAGCVAYSVTSVANTVITAGAGGAGNTGSNATDLQTDYSSDSAAGGNATTFTGDGLFSLIFGAGQGSTGGVNGLAGSADTASGAYVSVAANGATLTADGAGGINEIDAMLLDRFIKFKLGINKLWVGAKMMLDFKKLVVGGGAAPLVRLNLDLENMDKVASGAASGGMVIGWYMNPFGMSIGNPNSGKMIPIYCHPFLPNGVILGTTEKLPYNLPNNAPLLEIETLQEWYQVDWPVTQLQWESGLYLDSVLKMRYGPAFCGLMNLSNLA